MAASRPHAARNNRTAQPTSRFRFFAKVMLRRPFLRSRAAGRSGHLIAEFDWRFTRNLFEYIGKISRILIPYHFSHLIDLQLDVFKKLLGFLHTASDKK